MTRFAGSGARIERIGRSAIEARIPTLRPAWPHAISAQGCADLDVGGLHQHYLSRARDR